MKLLKNDKRPENSWDEWALNTCDGIMKKNPCNNKCQIVLHAKKRRFKKKRHFCKFQVILMKLPSFYLVFIYTNPITS